MEKQKTINSVTNYLSIISTDVAMSNKLFLFDKAKLSEDLYSMVFNITYDLKLKNLNQIKVNFPAIDLGDIAKKRCYQISSHYSAAKVESTKEMFFKHSLDKDFNNLKMFFICENEQYVNDFSERGIDIKIITLVDLIRDINNISLGRLKVLDYFLAKELYGDRSCTPAFCRYRLDLFLPRIIEINKPDDASEIDKILRTKIFEDVIDNYMLSTISHLVTEIVENIYNYNPTIIPQVKVTIGSTKVSIAHNGTPFSPQRLAYGALKPKKNMGSKVYRKFRRMFRGKCKVHYRSGEKKSEAHKAVFNFNQPLHSIDYYRECTIFEHESRKRELFDHCPIVYFLPDPFGSGSTSKRTAQLEYSIKRLPKGFKPGIALYKNDPHIIETFKDEYPDINFLILDSNKKI